MSSTNPDKTVAYCQYPTYGGILYTYTDGTTEFMISQKELYCIKSNTKKENDSDSDSDTDEENYSDSDSNTEEENDSDSDTDEENDLDSDSDTEEESQYDTPVNECDSDNKSEFLYTEKVFFKYLSFCFN